MSFLFQDLFLFEILKAIGIKNIIMFFSALLLFLLFEKLIIRPLIEIPVKEYSGDTSSNIKRETLEEKRINTEYYYDKAIRKMIKKKCSSRILRGKSLLEGYTWDSPKGTIAIKGIFNDGGMLRPLYVSALNFEIASLNGIGKEPIKNPFEFGREEADKNDYNIIVTNNYIINKDAVNYDECTYNSAFIQLSRKTYVLTNGEIGLKEFSEFYDGLEQKTNEPISVVYTGFRGGLRVKEIERK